MGKTLLLKTFRAALTLWIVVTFIFVILRLTGDPVFVLLPEDTPQQILDFYREKWGLNAPLWQQYLTYLASVVQLDLGYSFLDDRPAVELAFERFPQTLLLGISGFIFALVVGLGLGTIAALWRGSLVDRVVMALSTAGYAMPSFFLSILLVLLFSLKLRLLPASGSSSWQHLILPMIAVGLAGSASLARFTRSALLEVLGQPFLRTARGKGLPARLRLLRHAAPNALIALLPVLGFSFGGIISGSVVIETIFAWPGMGRLFIQAVGARDFAVVQAVILIIAACVVAANFIADLLHLALDPRLRAAKRRTS